MSLVENSALNVGYGKSESFEIRYPGGICYNAATEKTDEFYKLVEEAGISVVYIPSSESIESIYEDINFIADITNTEEKGKEIVDNLLELNKTNVDDSVKYAVLLYCMYKIKGGK